MTSIIESEQIIAARALLRWTQADLAEKSNVHINSVKKAESDASVKDSTLSSIIGAFQDSGIEFIEDGVRRKKDLVTIWDDDLALNKLFDDIYHDIKVHGGEIYISGKDEKVFKEHMGSLHDYQAKRMAKLDNFTCKCLIREEDLNPSAVGYAEYRAIPDELFINLPFYIYNDKMAIIIWGDKDQVILLHYKDLAEAYKNQFNIIWETAKRSE